MFGAIGLALLFVVVQGLAFGVLFGLGLDIDVEESLGAREALLLVAIQCVGIAAVAGLVGLGAVSWRRIGATGAQRGSLGAGMWALLPVGLLVVGPSLAVPLFDDDPLLNADLTPGSAIALTLLAIAIGVNEELWFRGLVVERLQRARMPWLTVFAASVLFGLPHVAATSASLVNAAGVTLAVAVPFTVVRLASRSIWPMVVWHAIIDAWAFLHTSTVVAEGSYDLGEALVALVLPAAVAIGYVVWFARVGRSRVTP